MKTLFTIAITFTLIAGMSFTAYAADATNTAGGKLTIPATNTGKTLEFIPSANTLLACDSAATTYTIASTSSKVTTDNGMQYGMTQGFNGYYQTTKTASLATSGVTDWTPMGGGS